MVLSIGISLTGLFQSLSSYATADLESLNILSFSYCTSLVLVLLSAVSIVNFCRGNNKKKAYLITSAFSWITIIGISLLLIIDVLIKGSVITLKETMFVFYGNFSSLNSFLQTYSLFFTLKGYILTYLFSSCSLFFASLLKADLEHKEK